MTVAELIDAFFLDRQRAGVRESSLGVYRTRLKTLRETLGNREFKSLTRSELLAWIDQESHWPDDYRIEAKQNQRKRPDTIRMILTVAAMLQNFALDREVIDAPILKPKDLRKPKSRRRERLATPEETKQILAAASPAFRLIYQALRRTGARPNELVGANIEQIVSNGERRTLLIAHHKTSGKDGRLRKIPISRAVAEYFDAAIGDRTQGPIFLNSKGERWKREQLTTTFRRIRRRLGLDESLALYATRHEFGSAMTRKRGLLAAKEALGHSSVQTTEIYAHMNDDELHDCQADLFDEEDGRSAA